MPRLTPPTPRRAETRRRLIDAAIAVVAKHGFHGATVDEIARQAGFSVGAIYSNFGSKDDLFIAVVDEHVEWFVARLAEMEQTEDPAAGATEWLDLMGRQPEQFLVFIEFWAYAVRIPKLRRGLAQRMERMRTAAGESLERRIAATGTTPQIAPEVAIPLALALGRGLALEKLVDGGAVSSEALAPYLAALIS